MPRRRYKRRVVKGARAEMVEMMKAMVEKLEGIEKHVDDFVKPPG